MPVVALVGAQWGDEGKGKIVDQYAAKADVVVRYSGGANAGHTLVVDDDRVVLHLIPSGALQPRTTCVIGQGTVIDPEALLKEIQTLEDRGLPQTGRLWVSDRAHVVMPYHFTIDAMREEGARPLGTTRRGIGPAYEDKTARRGVRLGDLLRPERLGERVSIALAAWAPFFRVHGLDPGTAEQLAGPLAEVGARLQPYVTHTARWLAESVARGDRVLLEGAQGTMLDIDHGTYPFVTSAATTAGGACTGAGLGPTQLDRVVGITKAYATRVGAGPFPTELDNEEGERLRRIGDEFGATTGRPRRCGWLDLVALRHAVRVNGLSALALTKLDVLTGLDAVRLCTGYRIHGELTDELPYDDFEAIEPVYETVAGWSTDLSTCRSLDALPTEARAYIRRIEEAVGCPIVYVSVGPDRAAGFGQADLF